MATVITEGTANVVQAALQTQTRLIHMSTDSIFSGTRPPYTETAPPSPLNEYGRAKAQAEAIVQQLSNHVIIRTSLVYGLQKMDHGTDWMTAALQAGQPVTLFTDQRRNPVWVKTLCQACLELTTSPFTGILNVAGQQAMTRAEFALKMLDYWQFTARSTLIQAPSPPGQWPLDCTLDLSQATAVLQTPLLGVDQVLQMAAATKR
jgi:dTDP-4-dehydrorhamnose reductase